MTATSPLTSQPESGVAPSKPKLEHVAPVQNVHGSPHCEPSHASPEGQMPHEPLHPSLPQSFPPQLGTQAAHTPEGPQVCPEGQAMHGWPQPLSLH